MATKDFDEVVDDLYGLDPSGFVSSRTDYVKEARSAGDKELAAAIGDLRKPTQVAWMVNILARQRPAQVGELLDLGAAILSAQRRASADQIRALSVQRQQVVGALAEVAADLARERGASPSSNAIREVAGSLRAGLADPDVGEAVRRGRMVTAAEYSGLGPPGLTAVRDGDSSTRRRRSEAHSDTHVESSDVTVGSDATAEDDARSRERAEALAEAEERAAQATADADEAEHRLTDAEVRVSEIQGELEPLREKLARLDEELRFARRQAKNADTESRKAARARDRARTEVARLRD